MATWRTTVRRSGGVEKAAHPTLDAALAALEGRLDELAGAVPRGAQRGLAREYTPAEVVALRGELRGPSGRRGGIDVHGDRSTTAWTGRLRRTAVAVRPGETSYGALARVLAG